MHARVTAGPAETDVEPDDLLDRGPQLRGDPEEEGPVDVLAAVSASRQRDAALATAVAERGTNTKADPKGVMVAGDPVQRGRQLREAVRERAAPAPGAQLRDDRGAQARTGADPKGVSWQVRAAQQFMTTKEVDLMLCRPTATNCL